MREAFTVCVFSGAREGTQPHYREAVRHFGQRLGERGLGLVYGGAQVGLMGVLADAALAAGARVTGVLPRALGSAEVAHAGLTELLLTEGLHARKAEMSARSTILRASLMRIAMSRCRVAARDTSTQFSASRSAPPA